MRTEYNGYSFECSANPQLTLYNPYSVVQYLHHQEFANYLAQSSTASVLVKLIKVQSYPSFDNDGATVNYIDRDIVTAGRINLTALLWATGYLTIDSYDPRTGNYTLTYPNNQARTSLLRHVSYWHIQTRASVRSSSFNAQFSIKTTSSTALLHEGISTALNR